MEPVLRVSLPGYDALIDTNLDHYSVYADIDNVLIKRFLTGTASLPFTGTPQSFSHDLLYIPFFTVFMNDPTIGMSTGSYSMVCNHYNPFEVPGPLAAVDQQNLYIFNTDGSGTIQAAYDVFYDDMTDLAFPTLEQESDQVFKVSRPGKDALFSKNPNDYIVHSDLNNFKILKEGEGVYPVTSGVITIPHKVNITSPTKYYCFVKPPDGKSLMVGGINGDGTSTPSFNRSLGFTSQVDLTNITINVTGTSPATLPVKWYITGTGQAGMIKPRGQVLSVTKPGFDATTETNPENFNFHSDFATLKYFVSGSDTFTNVSTTTTHVIAHNLGYVPFFITFVNDLQLQSVWNNGQEPVYALVPYNNQHGSIAHPGDNNGAFAWADGQNLYLQLWFDSGYLRGPINATFYYKIFRNNLGL